MWHFLSRRSASALPKGRAGFVVASLPLPELAGGGAPSSLTGEGRPPAGGWPPRVQSKRRPSPLAHGAPAQPLEEPRAPDDSCHHGLWVRSAHGDSSPSPCGRLSCCTRWVGEMSPAPQQVKPTGVKSLGVTLFEVTPFPGLLCLAVDSFQEIHRRLHV